MNRNAAASLAAFLLFAACQTGTVHTASKDITGFSILGIPASIGINTIALTVPNGTDVTALVPTIAITGVSVSPASGVANNFSSPVVYTVTAADNTTKAYTVTVTVAGPTGHWVTGYHPTWWYGALTPSMIDFDSLTHIIIFPAQDALSSAPYFDDAGMDDGNDYPQIVSLAHAKGVKVILSVVGGYGQTNMPVVAADATKCQAFVNAACSYALSKGADGIELDWEFPRAGDKVGWNRLISLFRQQLDTWSPRGLLMTSMYYSISGADDGPYQRDAMVAAFDQINPMTYTMWMGEGSGPYRSGYDTPVNLPTQFNPYYGYSLSDPAGGGPLSFLAAGYPAEKIGISISFEGTRFGGVTTMGQQYSSWGFVSTVTQSLSPGGYPSIPTTGRVWDPAAQANYCINGGYAYSFQDVNSVRAISTWAMNNGFGGIMIYDLGPGYDLAAAPHDILLKTIASVTLR